MNSKIPLGGDKIQIRNEHIRDTENGQVLTVQTRLRWYGHVKRRDDDYVGRKVLEMKFTGKEN